MTALLTRIVYDYLFSFRYTTLSLLAAVQVVLGLLLLNTTRFAWHTIILVVSGIIVGQLWLVKLSLMFFF